MARKRHLASTARGLFGFCLAPSIRKPIRSIRLIRGRTETSRGQEGLSLFIALRWMQEPGGVMVWLAENIQACLRDFLAATASMARKRHLASTARGFCCFCLMTLVTTGLIRPIHGEKKNLSSGVLPLTLLNLGCTRHSSSQLGSALICTRFQAEVSH